MRAMQIDPKKDQYFADMTFSVQGRDNELWGWYDTVITGTLQQCLDFIDTSPFQLDDKIPIDRVTVWSKGHWLILESLDDGTPEFKDAWITAGYLKRIR